MTELKAGRQLDALVAEQVCTEAETAPLAICLAALETVDVMR